MIIEVRGRRIVAFEQIAISGALDVERNSGKMCLRDIREQAWLACSFQSVDTSRRILCNESLRASSRCVIRT